MAIGFLEFNLKQPTYLDFGRSADIRTHSLLIRPKLPTPKITTTINANFAHGPFGPNLEYTTPIYCGATIKTSLCSPIGIGEPVHAETNICYHKGIVKNPEVRVTYHRGIPSPAVFMLPYHKGVRSPVAISSPYHKGVRVPVPMILPYHKGVIYPVSSSLSYHRGIITIIPRSLTFQKGTRTPAPVLMPYHSGIVGIAYRTTWWHNGIFPIPGRWRTEDDIPYPEFKTIGKLDFRCLQGRGLDFGSKCFGMSGWLVIPKVGYRVLNSGSLIRVSDGKDIPVASLSVSTDIDAFCWSFSATILTQDGADAVAQGTVVQATINTFIWRFVVDERSFSRDFGQFSAQISGRSLTALLQAPYAPIKTYHERDEHTAVQLIDKEMPLDGSFVYQWGIEPDQVLMDWLIPAGTFKYENLSALEVIKRITQATGARIYSDPVAKKLWFLPRWRVLPWNWSSTAAQATLPSAYTLSEKRTDKSSLIHNGIMVYGGIDGLAVMAKIAGTAGDITAQPINDLLITHVDAGRARAAQELADLWPMREYTLELPLQKQPQGAGLMLPGTFFDFSSGPDSGWRGLSISIDIKADFNNTQQSITAVAP